MNTLAQARQEIKLVLDRAGYSVSTFVPARPTPPLVVLEPGEPYMEEGETFSSFNVRFQLICLAAVATNEKATEALDQMIMDIVDELETYFIDSVERPGSFEANGVSYLGTTIQISDRKEIQT